MSSSYKTDQFEPRVEILGKTEEWSFPPGSSSPIFHIDRVELRFQKFNGEMSDRHTLINFERGDSVGVLLYDQSADSVVLVRQFRYPVYASQEGEARTGSDPSKAWILEVVAGIKETDESPAEVARRELLEEAGFVLTGPLEPIATIYVSPGGTSERIHLFLGPVDCLQPAASGGGVVAEGEDIQVIVIPLEAALSMIGSGEIDDAKTIVALQHLALASQRS